MISVIKIIRKPSSFPDHLFYFTGGSPPIETCSKVLKKL